MKLPVSIAPCSAVVSLPLLLFPVKSEYFGVLSPGGTEGMTEAPVAFYVLTQGVNS